MMTCNAAYCFPCISCKLDYIYLEHVRTCNIEGLWLTETATITNRYSGSEGNTKVATLLAVYSVCWNIPVVPGEQHRAQERYS